MIENLKIRSDHKNAIIINIKKTSKTHHHVILKLLNNVVQPEMKVAK